MRILFLSTYFKPDVAATGVLMTHLAEDLIRLGHEITVLTSMPHYSGNEIRGEYRGRFWTRETSGPLNIHRLYLYVPRGKRRLAGRALNYATWNILSFLVGGLMRQNDLLFVPSPPLTNGLAGWLLSRLHRMPYIYNVQDIYPDVAVRLGVLRDGQLVRVLQSMEKFIYSRAAAVSVISEGFKSNLILKGVPEKKLKVIPNFVDAEFIRPLPRQNSFSAAHELDGRFVVLFAGNVGLSQGLDRVLEAAALLKGHPEVLFWIVGGGASKDSLQAQAERMRLENVKFLPFFPYGDIPDIYASSDVCLVPLKKGLTGESVPSKVYSILAAARPLIASVDEDSDTCRLIKEADCGLCLTPEDPQAMAGAILNLYRNRGSGVRMGNNGRRFVESNFSRQHIAEEYERLFKSVLNGGNLHGS